MSAPRGNYRRSQTADKKNGKKKSLSPSSGARSKKAQQVQRAGRQKTRPASSTPRRKGRPQEILGFLLIALVVLVTIASVTYSQNDSALITGDGLCSGLRNLYLPSPFCISEVQNAGGPLGAWIAEWVVPRFFGFTSLLLTSLLAVWGYRILRKRSLWALLKPSLITVGAMAYAGILIGRIDTDLVADIGLFSGNLGNLASDWLTGTTGPLGSYVILATVLVIGLMLLIDGDLQKTLDRFERMFSRIRSAANQGRAAAVKTLESATAKDRTSEQVSWDDLDDSGDTPAPPATEHAAPRISRADDTRAEVAENIAVQTEIATDAGSDVELSVVGQVTEAKARSVNPRSGQRSGYKFPSIGLLDKTEADAQHIDYDELEENKQILLDKLAVYKIEITSINAVVGPTVTLYELTPVPGVKVSQIKSREDDLAMAMAARGIRMIAPIPGKAAVGVEIPNRNREFVRLSSVIGTKKFRDADMELPVALGKTIEGEVYLQDLAKMPHLLIAGATGSGKSVGLNTFIAGLLYACQPSDLKFVMVDPKKIELQQYRELIDHYLAVPEDGGEAIITEVAEALAILRACEREMSERYDLLQDARVRGVKQYNKAFAKGELDPATGHKHLPYIVVIIDELADLMMTAGKEIEAPIARLAQMARAIGIHLVLATQRPSVDVITGLIKANFPSRVAFQVASKIDARTILDQNGAEQLVGNGDMLYMSGSKLLRLQGPFVSVGEIDRLVQYISEQPGPGPYMLPAVEDEPELTVSGGSNSTDARGRDELFAQAAQIVVLSQQGSVSLIQRKLSIGYTRAARIVDQLEQAGIVGAYVGAKAREVLITDVQALEDVI